MYNYDDGDLTQCYVYHNNITHAEEINDLVIPAPQISNYKFSPIHVCVLQYVEMHLYMSLIRFISGSQMFGTCHIWL